MDINVIFKNKISIDNDKNFAIRFKNEKEVISLLLNKKKDYFLTNAVVYLNEPKNDEKDKDIGSIKKLETQAKNHIEMEEKNKFDAPFAKNFMIT